MHDKKKTEKEIVVYNKKNKIKVLTLHFKTSMTYQRLQKCDKLKQALFTL